MTCRKFYVYPLLFSLITIFASPTLLAAADLQALVHALEDSWSNKVTEKDLKVKLPKKYLLMHERSGGTSPTLRIIENN